MKCTWVIAYIFMEYLWKDTQETRDKSHFKREDMWGGWGERETSADFLNFVIKSKYGVLFSVIKKLKYS